MVAKPVFVKQEAGAKVTKPKKKPAKREASPEAAEEDAIAGGGTLSPDLTEVSKKLGNTPQCFYNLNPEIIMQKKLKVGRSLDAVPCLNCSHSGLIGFSFLLNRPASSNNQQLHAPK